MRLGVSEKAGYAGHSPARSGVLTLFFGRRIPIRLLAGGDVYDRLGELVGVPGAFGMAHF
jgi:hypothetical protein